METLRRIRTMHGLNQVDLAEASGVSQNTISEIETGRREARPATLRKLARALNVEIADFFEDTDSPKAEAPPSYHEPSFNDVLEEERRAQTLEEVKERFKPFADGLNRYCERWEVKAQRPNPPEDVADFFADLLDLGGLIGHVYTSELYAIANALSLDQRADAKVVSRGVPEEKVTGDVRATLDEHSHMRQALRRYYATGAELAKSIGNEEIAGEVQRMVQAVGIA